MRLSDAIREGCKISLKATGTYVLEGARILAVADHAPPTAEHCFFACALGAALLGAGCDQEQMLMRPRYMIEEMFPEVTKARVQVPEAREGVDRPIFEVVIYLNDVLGWSREAIADWLDSISLDLVPVKAGQHAEVEA